MPDNTNDFHVERELYLAAPPGLAAYSQNPSYVSAAGMTLVESVKHEALHIDAQGRKVYYHPRIFRRYSHDNGRTWTATSDQSVEHPETLAGRRRTVSLHGLDVLRDAVVSIYCNYEVDPSQEMFAVGNLRKRTIRPWYELSFDGGKHWTVAKPVVDERRGYDETHWGPDLIYGYSGAQSDLSAPVWLGDGSVVFGLTLTHAPLPGDKADTPGRGGRMGVAYMRGRWNRDGTDMTWQIGESVVLAAGQSPAGCCEPAPAALGGERLFNVMRCQGDESAGIFSTRYATHSIDGGQTWSTPEPLRYDDGQIVWTPASFSAFFHSTKSGRWFWLANILPGPVHGQSPRYPLSVAAFDPERCRIIRSSVRVIQDRPPGLPHEVRYTNWGCYEDRVTGEMVLTLPEQPKLMDFSAMTRPEQFTADCMRYRIRL